MNGYPGASAYLEAKVFGSSREQLVVLLYERLVALLSRARKEIAEGNIEGKAQSLDKASAILFELLSSLDFEAGGELASRLAALYSFFIGEIGEAGRTMQAERLDPVITMVRTLYDVWNQAAAALAAGAGKAEAAQ
ncbi:MAG TPA: flagellar export chaperone FliS [Longimicrobiales bacterium]|nr:flagellar export chaperone FliS [Longimicrobiales bacterium]